VRTGIEVALFVTRREMTETLVVHRSPAQGGYWHVVAGGVEPGETPAEAAPRELLEETGLVGEVHGPVARYAYPLREEPPERRARHDPLLEEVQVECFHVVAPDDWEPTLDWEHDGYRWCDPGEASRTLRWQDTAAAMRSLWAS
jgi:8-oxo-dGTP pyrophosphatase MutT (NUDIX family)